MLFGCIYVPDFPVQAVLRAEPESSISFQKNAIAVLDGPESLLKIYSCNEPARQAGIAIGMTKLQAEACPGVELRRRSAEQENFAQADLLECASSFSPRVESTAPGAVIFDLTGAERLLGSQQRIGKQIAASAADFSFAANTALATNADTAFHAARGLASITVIPQGQEALRLGCLPVEVLAPSPEILDTLDSWGIRDFKALAALPSVPLTQRLGQQGLHLQRLARGEVERELVPAAPPPSFCESLELEEAIELLEPLGFVVNRLLEELISRLRERSLATDHVQLDLAVEVHCDRQIQPIDSKTSAADTPAEPPPPDSHQRTLKLPVPTQDSKVLLKLLQLDLAAHPPTAPVKKVSVEVFPARVRTTQTGLFQPLAPEPAQLEITLARLRAAVGEKDEQGRERVGFPRNLDSHRPDSFQVLSRAEESRETKPRKPPNWQKEILECLPALQLVLRRFRPPLAACVECRPAPTEERKTNPKIPAAVIFNGIKAKVIQACGPWRSSGWWWDAANRWQRDEWDIAVGLNGASGLYRIFQDIGSGQWFVEGMYD